MACVLQSSLDPHSPHVPDGVPDGLSEPPADRPPPRPSALRTSNIDSTDRRNQGLSEPPADRPRDGGPPLKPDDAHYRFVACCLETYGAFGPDAQALITDIADHAEQTAPYLDFGANWAAPDIAATARCMVSVAIRIGVSQQLRAIADLKSSRPRFACPRRTQRRRGVATARVNPNVARM